MAGHPAAGDEPVEIQAARRMVKPLRLDFRGLPATYERSDSKVRLPEVKAVTEFLMRRQFYRDVTTPVLAKLLKESFTGLKSLSREN